MKKVSITPRYSRPLKWMPLSFQSSTRVCFGESETIFFDFTSHQVFRESNGHSISLALLYPASACKTIGGFLGTVVAENFKIVIEGSKFWGVLHLKVHQSICDAMGEQLFTHFYLQRSFKFFEAVRMDYDERNEQLRVEYTPQSEELVCVLGAILIAHFATGGSGAT